MFWNSSWQCLGVRGNCPVSSSSSPVSTMGTPVRTMGFPGSAPVSTTMTRDITELVYSDGRPPLVVKRGMTHFKVVNSKRWIVFGLGWA